ncbi:glycosyltransferase [Microbacterium sp. CJ88]|uniref:glycosyltransferase n=1 Tax=Microbacterium sp. CJ88 TaxID=3445672 RepID=UPI003F65C586
MRLFFDARYVRTDFHDGISRFSVELARAASEAAAARGVEITYLVHDPAQVDHLPPGVRTLRIHAPTSVREPFTAVMLNRHQPDVVFSPMQMIGSLGRRFALLLTLHDTIYYRHRTPPSDLPGFVRLGWRLFHLSYVPQRITLDRADVVVTVSQTSKRQLAAARLTRRPIIVVPNAPRRLGEQWSATGRPSGAPARNIMYMGSFMPYKNVETLVRAMAHLPGRRLHLLSRISPTRRAELEALASPGAEVVFHDGTTDAAYEAMLVDDAVLATASLDEGYGLPLAEALELGVPAVVSDLEIFHEVAGDGALYVDPRDPEAFAAAISALDDDAVRAAVVAAGSAHIAHFSWSRSAGILLDTVAELAEDRAAPGARRIRSRSRR